MASSILKHPFGFHPPVDKGPHPLSRMNSTGEVLEPPEKNSFEPPQRQKFAVCAISGSMDEVWSWPTWRMLPLCFGG